MTDERLILGFDTSAAHCAAALLCGDRILATRGEDMGRGQAERLLPMLQELLAEAGVAWRDLNAIGVGVGPGNFTGIRIAVAAARGLALGLGVPAIGVSAFAALREGLPVAAIASVAAPRGSVYLSLPGADPVGPALPHDLTDAIAGSGLPVVGAEAERLATASGGQVLAPPYPLAEAIARVARARLGGETPLPKPLYIRPADVAPSREQPPVLLD